MIRFDRFELDPHAYRLRRDGERVAVEPKVLDLLVVLIEHRDTVVPKQELLDAVWPDQDVTESVLTQAIYEIRRALGESSHEAGHVRTVHGRGYQFRGEVAAKDVGTETGPTPTQPHAEQASGTQPVRRWLPVLIALATVVLLSSLWLLTRREPDPGPTQVAAVIPVALVPIAATSPDPGLKQAALSITDQLAYRIERVPGLALRSVDYAGSSIGEARSLAEYAVRNGARLVLTGALEPTADQDRGRLSVRMVEIRSLTDVESTPLGRFELPSIAEGEMSQFLRVEQAILDRLMERFEGVSIEAHRASSLPEVDAYQLYLRAIESMANNFCDSGAATNLLERALEIDSNSALIWTQHASSLYNQVFACGADADNYHKALASLQQATRLDPEAVPAHMTRAAILIETGHVEDAYEGLLALREEFPRRPEILFEMDYALYFAGYLEESIASSRAGLRLDPQFYVAFERGGVPNNLLYAGRLEEYLDILPATGTAYHRFHRGLALFRLGRLKEARQALEPAFRENPEDLFGRFSHALLAIMSQDVGAARSIVRQIVAQRQALGASDGEITYRQAQILALAGDFELAIENFEQAIDQGFVCTPYFRSDPLVESIRHQPEFVAALRRAEARRQEFGKRFGLVDAQGSPLGNGQSGSTS